MQQQRRRPPLWQTGSSSVVGRRARYFELLLKHAGVDNEQLQWGNDEEEVEQVPLSSVEQTIQEDAEAETGPPAISDQTPRKAKRGSYQRLSKLSDEARLSISSLQLSPDKRGTDSNRSSVTIKGPQVNGTNTSTWSESDFEHALKKFATQRESFLLDMDLMAGAVVPSRPTKPRPKTQRIISEDGLGPRTGIGSIRRRLSSRNMSSTKRQTSVKRSCKAECHTPNGQD